MPSDITVNDAILQPFLTARDSDESQRELMILFSVHADSRMMGIIVSRLCSYLNGQEHIAVCDDLYSEAKTRLLTYLRDLKEGKRNTPCEDFPGYVAAIAHNTCNDHFREAHPARRRLHKKIRDLIRSNPNFAVWKSQDQKRGEWLCGFQDWEGRRSSSISTAWLQRFFEHAAIVTEELAPEADIQWMATAELLSAIFNDVGEPISLNELVSVVSDIRGIKDTPIASFDASAAGLSLRLPDSRLRIDSVLEMREPLVQVWKALRELSHDQFRAYLLYSRDSSEEDLISLFLDAEITSESEIAGLLKMTVVQFRDLCTNKLPMDNAEIAKELGVKVERVYKLRCQAAKRLKNLLSVYNEKTTAVKQKSHSSPS
jgi:RNA polymerase sigma factor (sigma-70 family)